MNDRAETILPPPPALLSRNPARWVRYFGPGAIIASVTIASGETLFASRAGSIFGYEVLWVILYVCILKWVLCYCSMRHMILSGGHPFERWSHLAGPRGWFPLFIFLIAAICWPMWFGFLSGVLGTACRWIFGTKAVFAGKDIEMWATIFSIVAIVIIYIGSYRFLEIGQILIVSILMICMVIAMFYLVPDWRAALSGTFVPRELAYPDWIFDLKPEMKDRTPWLEVIVFTSAIGGASIDYLAYLSFLRDKKWGHSHLGLATDEELAPIAERKDHSARQWVKAALADSVCSLAVVAFITGCFSILGAIVLRPQHLFPNDEDLLNYQGEFLTALAPWLLPLYKVVIFAAFISILYGLPELAYRVWFEYFNTLPRVRRRVAGRKLRVAVAVWCLLGGNIILWVTGLSPDRDLIKFISPAGIYTGVLSCGFFCLANPWMDWRFLPRRLWMNGWLVALNVVAGVIFMVMGFKALWDNWDYNDHRYLAFVVLAAQILFCMLIVHIFRKFLYPDHPAGESA